MRFLLHVCICNVIWLKSVLKDLINNDTTVVNVMDWHYAGAKPLSEAMVAQFAFAYMCHWTSIIEMNKISKIIKGKFTGYATIADYDAVAWELLLNEGPFVMGNHW